MNRPPPGWYTLAWMLALPLVALYLLWRGVRQPEYRRHWAERFLGRAGVSAASSGPGIWIHAVSVGETRAAQPLVQALARAHPHAHFVLTHMTPTGRAAGRELAHALPGRIHQRYLPYDLPFAIARFLSETRPAVGVLMETEIWPNLLQGARARGVPLVLANARLSERSLRKALRTPGLIRGAAANLAVVGAQSAADRDRIARLFDGPVHVTGNAKFDLAPDATLIERGRQLRAHLAAHLGARPLWLFASTRDGEEQLLLEALRHHTAGDAPGPLLLFVPRHPQRFDTVAALLREQGVPVMRRAQWDTLQGDRPQRETPQREAPQRDTPQRDTPQGEAPQGEAPQGEAPQGEAPQGEAPQGEAPQRDTPQRETRQGERPQGGRQRGAAVLPILLGDSMGEMPLYYAMADVALIGGSLLPLGGQNLIEACACGCPVVMGPHMFNFAAAADGAVARGAAVRVPDAGAALRAMQGITDDTGRREAMAGAARAFAVAHRGATAHTMALIEQVMSAAPARVPAAPATGAGV